MGDYAKMKNSELETLLKERNLPTNGRKAEMVARLQEADAANSNQSTKETPAKSPTSAKSAVAATQSKANASVSPEVDKKAESQGQQPITGEPETGLGSKEAVDDAANTGNSEAKDSSTFNANLATTSLDEEIARRKKRAEKFGMTEQESEAIKNLERQQRFGTSLKGGEVGENNEASTVGVNKLDEALSNRKPRGAKRGRDEDGGNIYEDEHLIKRRGGFRGRGRGQRSRGAPRGHKGDNAGAPRWMNNTDRAARDKRSAKFGS